MKKFAEQFNKKAEGIKLRADERNELRERLLAYMEYHPLPESQQTYVRRPAESEKTIYARVTNAWFMSRVVSVTAVFFLLVIPAMAERALPGDVLYPVKVRFNEELRGALVSSPYQKIEWETERLERRVAEARLLADAGLLTPAAEADVASAIRSHSAAAKNSIDSIRLSDNDEASIASITLASALEVSAEVLEGPEGGVNARATSSSALADAVSDAHASVASGSTDASYQKLMSRIELETTRAYEYLDSLSTVTTDESRNDIQRRLDDIKMKVGTAVEMREEDEVAAAQLLAEALSSTRKAISYMTNLDVRKNVLIEDLLPTTPTTEERRLNLENKLEENEEMITQVITATNQLATTSDQYIELTDGMEYYQVLQQSITDALADDDISAAETAAKSAGELVRTLIESLNLTSTSTNATSTSGQ